eukprot:GFUD01029186.1.p1 GENE.GFUD01029186.1~~GFUD01029186.1.p1  ORF type:complete len:147 (-),score=27.27 GFUD01029186.1:69-485(-)
MGYKYQCTMSPWTSGCIAVGSIIVILMPAVCSICYHTYKHKYGLGQDADSELGEVHVYFNSALADHLGNSNKIVLERVEFNRVRFSNDVEICETSGLLGPFAHFARNKELGGICLNISRNKPTCILPSTQTQTTFSCN